MRRAGRSRGADGLHDGAPARELRSWPRPPVTPFGVPRRLCERSHRRHVGAQKGKWRCPSPFGSTMRLAGLAGGTVGLHDGAPSRRRGTQRATRVTPLGVPRRLRETEEGAPNRLRGGAWIESKRQTRRPPVGVPSPQSEARGKHVCAHTRTRAMSVARRAKMRPVCVRRSGRLEPRAAPHQSAAGEAGAPSCLLVGRGSPSTTRREARPRDRTNSGCATW
jgi:hypothetical protein